MKMFSKFDFFAPDLCFPLETTLMDMRWTLDGHSDVFAIKVIFPFLSVSIAKHILTKDKVLMDIAVDRSVYNIHPKSFGKVTDDVMGPIKTFYFNN